MAETMVSERMAASVQETVSDAEWDTRVNLAAAFRVAHHFGWNDTINNHITARVPDEPEHFLMNPVGLGWHEVTASNLIKADFAGNILSETDMTLAPAGFNFHSAIIDRMRHLNCVFHIHPIDGVVVSAMKDGLLIVDQSSCALHGHVSYHDFEGLAQEKDEAPRIIADLGGNYVMIMWNHGLLSVGRTIGEAFGYMRRLVSACEKQVQLMSTGAEIRHIPDDVLRFTQQQMARRRGNSPLGGLDWKMYLRLAEKLDPAFRT